MRLFIGIALPEELKPKALEVQKALGSTGEKIKLVEPENLHITVKFLGEVEKERLDGIKTVLSSILKKRSVFSLKIHGISYLPNKKFLRTVALSVLDENNILKQIVDDINSYLAKIGIKDDVRDYKAHLTLARVKGTKDRINILLSLMSFEDIDIGEVEVTTFDLMESMLTESGPIYNKIASFTIK
ncbi:MAG: RNA 2',3'-cyclic phosphodiesterase [Candidatus Aenigmarchaeota archaeon]|nr:RNA 2',3'-cyclic phosphodiesterase [Candidatus Aenigmarchaeota archaeon]